MNTVFVHSDQLGIYLNRKQIIIISNIKEMLQINIVINVENHMQVNYLN